MAVMASRYPFSKCGSREGGLEYSASSTVEFVSTVLEISAAEISCDKKCWMIRRQVVARHNTLTSLLPSNRPRTAAARVFGSESIDATTRSEILLLVPFDGMESKLV